MPDILKKKGVSLCQRISHDHHGTLIVAESAWGGAECVIALTAEPEQEG